MKHRLEMVKKSFYKIMQNEKRKGRTFSNLCYEYTDRWEIMCSTFLNIMLIYQVTVKKHVYCISSISWPCVFGLYLLDQLAINVSGLTKYSYHEKITCDSSYPKHCFCQVKLPNEEGHLRVLSLFYCSFVN